MTSGAPIMETRAVAEWAKEFLPDPTKVIRFDDEVTKLVRATTEKLTGEEFRSPLPRASPESIQQSLRQYEEAMRDALVLAILTGRWGREEHVFLLRKLLGRVAEG